MGKMILQPPQKKLIPSYIQAVRNGFQNMQLGFGDRYAQDISDAPEEYLKLVQSAEPFSFVMPDKTTFTVYDHALLWISDEDDFIGSVACRYKMDPVLEDLCGHIGVAISSPHQKKGYARKAVQMALGEFRVRNIHEIVYTVNPDNAPSIALAKTLNGHLRDTINAPYGFGPVQRYIISAA